MKQAGVNESKAANRNSSPSSMMIGIRPIHPSRGSTLRQGNIIPLRPKSPEVHLPPVDVRVFRDVAGTKNVLNTWLAPPRGESGGVGTKGNLGWVWTL